MGYYGSFEFDVTIPATKVQACVEAIRDAKNTNMVSLGTEDHKGLEKLLQETFFEADVYFTDDEKPPLTQLAEAAVDGSTHGDLRLEGYSHQKWRGYIDDTLCAIAPFVTPDSSVEVTGEEGERARWTFEGGQSKHEQSLIIWPAEQTVAQANDAIVQELADAIASGEDYSPAIIIRNHRPELFTQMKQAMLADG